MSDETTRFGEDGATWVEGDGAPAARETPARLGRHEIVEVIGAGGMGEILAVHDRGLDRVVAAKVIRGAVGEGALTAFLLEARVTGRLQHPGIVPVHELDRTPDGQPYFTMQRVEGADLAERIERLREGGAPPLSARDRVELLGVFLRICDALAYAHSRGVVHRDIKPANVMLGEFGEVLVMDWGLAKLLGTVEAIGLDDTLPRELGASADRRTMDGQIKGTPGYMAPEQARGEVESIDERTDVYALGALLYELLTLHRPFEGSAVEILTSVGEGRLVPPSQRAPEAAVPRALEAVVLRAMATSPDARYPSVAALREDVASFLADRPTTAAEYSAGQLLGLWVRRHRGLVAAALLALASAVAVGFRARLERLGQIEAASAEAAALMADVPSRAALEGELRGVVARGRLAEEALARRHADSLASCLGAVGALDRALARAGDDAALRRRRREAGQRLILCALATRSFAVAERARVELVAAGLSDGVALKRLIARARGARARHEVRALRALLVALAAREAPLDVLVHRARGFRGSHVRETLAAAVEPLRSRAEATGEPIAWTGAEKLRLRFVAQVLAPLGDDASVEVLARLLAVLDDEPLAVDLACALCDTRNEAARLPVETAMRRFGRSASMGRVRALLRRLPRAETPGDLDVERLAELATQRVREGDAEAALVLLDRAEARAPRRADLRDARGLALLELGRLAEARRAFDEALTLDPERVATKVHRARVLELLGDVAAALLDLDAAVDAFPQEYRIRLNRARVRLTAGRVREALEDADRVARGQPSPEAWLQRARALRQLDRFEEALRDVDRAQALGPELIPVRTLRAHVLVELGRPREALEALERALAMRPDHPAVYSERAWLMLAMGRSAEALADAERSLKHARSAEDRRGARRVRAMVWLLRKEVARARADVEWLLARFPQDGRHHAMHAEVLLGQGKLDAAEAAIRRADDRGSHPRTTLIRARVQKARGDEAGAIETLRGMVARLPRHGEAQLELGALLVGRDNAAAVETLKTALQLMPANRSIHAHLGMALLGQRKLREAQEALVEAVRRSPKDSRAWLMLGRARFFLRDLRGAVEAFDRSIALREFHTAYRGRGDARVHLGQFAGAVADYRKALALHPEQHWELHANLAVALHRTGDKAGAIAAFQRAIPLAPAATRPELEKAVRTIRREMGGG